jgi:DNA modification methylase
MCAEIADNSFICADCMEVLREIPDKKFDLCLTDPPYGVDLEYKSYFDSVANWKILMGDFIPKIRMKSKMVIMPSCQINLLPWIYSYHPPDWLICWYKGSPGHCAYIGFNDWEPLLVYGKQKSLSMHDYFYCRCSEKMGSYGHPCPKPIDWAVWLIERASKPGDLIIDPFCGSGTTAIACHKTGRRFVCIDKEPEYIRIAQQRYKNLIAQTELLPLGALGVTAHNTHTNAQG